MSEPWWLRDPVPQVDDEAEDEVQDRLRNMTW